MGGQARIKNNLLVQDCVSAPMYTLRSLNMWSCIGLQQKVVTFSSLGSNKFDFSVNYIFFVSLEVLLQITVLHIL